MENINIAEVDYQWLNDNSLKLRQRTVIEKTVYKFQQTVIECRKIRLVYIEV